jgi:hypothetical protein
VQQATALQGVPLNWRRTPAVEQATYREGALTPRSAPQASRPVASAAARRTSFDGLAEDETLPSLNSVPELHETATSPVLTPVRQAPPANIRRKGSPTTPDELAGIDPSSANDPLYEPCPSPKDYKRIDQVSTDISAQPGDFPPECGLGEDPFTPRMWAMSTYTWRASALCHKPLYWQQVPVERYGHTWGPVLQPFVSAANFYLTFPVLPYKMGLDPPNECIYDLGYYRPGSCAPYMIYPIPISLRAGLYEATAWTVGVILIP